jgi:hypothetical protein
VNCDQVYRGRIKKFGERPKERAKREDQEREPREGSRKDRKKETGKKHRKKYSAGGTPRVPITSTAMTSSAIHHSPRRPMDQGMAF